MIFRFALGQEQDFPVCIEIMNETSGIGTQMWKEELDLMINE